MHKYTLVSQTYVQCTAFISSECTLRKKDSSIHLCYLLCSWTLWRLQDRTLDWASIIQLITPLNYQCHYRRSITLKYTLINWIQEYQQPILHGRCGDTTLSCNSKRLFFLSLRNHHWVIISDKINLKMLQVIRITLMDYYICSVQSPNPHSLPLTQEP